MLCECKESDHRGFCKNDYIWNCRTYACECTRVCKIDEYLDTRNFSWKNLVN